MIDPSRSTEQSNIDRVHEISVGIWRHAQKKKWKTSGQFMNTTWSDEYFTIHFPLNANELFGTVRIERDGTHWVKVNISIPHLVQLMTQIAFTELGERAVEFEGFKSVTLKQAAFLLFCDHVKPGLSNPFRDMLVDGEL